MISVCMTTYNGAKYVKLQIDSILPQLHIDDELIICDDGSTDDTVKIIKGIEDKRIKLFNNHFHNHILNFESCLGKASGDYIFLCDQDDVWMSNKVETMCSHLETVDLVCSNCIVTDKYLNHKNKYFYDDPNKKNGIIRNLWHNQYLGCCMAFNRKVLLRSLPFPKNLITHDTWIGLVSELVGKSKFIDDPLILFRRHDNNTSNTCNKSNLSIIEMIKYRMTLIKGLCSNMLFHK